MAGALVLVPAIVAVARSRDYSTSGETPERGGSDAAAARINAAAEDASAAAARFGSSAALAAIVLCTALSFLHTQAEGVVRTFFNVYLDTELLAAPALIGTLSAAGQLLAAAASLATPLLLARFGVLPVLTGGSALKAVALLSFVVVRHWTGAGLGFAMMIAASSFVRPPFIVLQQSVVDARYRPVMSGATTAAAGLGFSLSAFAGGLVAASWGFRAVFAVAAVVAVTATVYVWGILRPNVAYRS
jgi:predicted MFS family arabinose efflux permease